MPEASDAHEIIALTDKLLQSITTADWKTYSELCDESLTCFEPEACGHLVEGLAFHQFYFDLGPATSPRNTTLCAPHVRMLGQDAAVISYVRLVQRLDGAGSPETVEFDETRVWQRLGGRWQHVHFHRSPR